MEIHDVWHIWVISFFLRFLSSVMKTAGTKYDLPFCMGSRRNKHMERAKLSRAETIITILHAA
jgi:hypothetical protein